MAASAFVGAAGELNLLDLVTAGDRLVRIGKVRTSDLVAAAAAMTGRGCVLARRAASLVRERVDSPRETWLRLLLVLAGLPEPAVNVGRGTEEEYLGRPDLSYEEFRLLLEYEGDHHRTDRRQWAYDIGRYEGFAADGWTVLRVTAEAARYRRGLVWRVTAALRAGGYTGPDPVFSPEWRQLFDQ